MDLGSIYSYKSNLRNAVDSAALAGASAYMRNDETAGSHPEADSRADDYLKPRFPIYITRIQESIASN